MRAALCFYGQPRFFDITHKLYYSLISEKYNVDVFIHTWWSEKLVGTLYPMGKHAEKTLSAEDRTVRENLIYELNELYKPKLIGYDDFNEIDIPKKTNYYQYYTQYAVKNLLEKYENDNGFKYDFVIRTRFDLLIEQNIPYQLDDSVWVSSALPYIDRYNDLFSFSSGENYKKISNTFLNLEEFEKINKGEMEWAFTMQVLKEKVNIKTFQANYATFDILRTETANKFR